MNGLYTVISITPPREYASTFMVFMLAFMMAWLFPPIQVDYADGDQEFLRLSQEEWTEASPVTRFSESDGDEERQTREDATSCPLYNHSTLRHALVQRTPISPRVISVVNKAWLRGFAKWAAGNESLLTTFKQNHPYQFKALRLPQPGIPDHVAATVDLARKDFRMLFSELKIPMNWVFGCDEVTTVFALPSGQ